MKTQIIKLFFLFSLLHFSQISAQDLDKYYTRRVQEGGDIFFVFPNEDFQNITNKTDFTFDITIREGNDTAIINFTYYSKEPSPAKSLLLVSSNKSVKDSVEKLYVDFVRKKWEQRYTAKVSFKVLQEMIKPETPLQFEVESMDQNFRIQTKTGKWKKYADALTKIFYIINPD